VKNICCIIRAIGYYVYRKLLFRNYVYVFKLESSHAALSDEALWLVAVVASDKSCKQLQQLSVVTEGGRLASSGCLG